MKLNTQEVYVEYCCTKKQYDYIQRKIKIINNSKTSQDRIDNMLFLLIYFQKFFRDYYGEKVLKIIKENEDINLSFKSESKYDFEMINDYCQLRCLFDKEYK